MNLWNKAKKVAKEISTELTPEEIASLQPKPVENIITEVKPPIEIKKEEIKKPETIKMQKESLSVMDFFTMAENLGVPQSEYKDYERQFKDLSTVDEWFNKSYALFTSRYEEILDILSRLEMSSQIKSDEKKDIPTLCKEYLDEVVKLQISGENTSVLFSFLTLIKKWNGLSGLTMNLTIYSQKMIHLLNLLEAYGALNFYYKQALIADADNARLELETFKHYAIENKKLKESQKKLSETLFSLESKYQQSIDEIKSLKVYLEVSNANPKSGDATISS